MTKRDEKLQVLFVDDDREVRESFLFTCEDYWDVQAVATVEAITSGEVSLDGFDVVILDLVFNTIEHGDEIIRSTPDPIKGLQTLHWIKSNYENVPVIILSAALDDGVRHVIGGRYPEVILLAKPINTSEKSFRKQIETYAAQHHPKK